jgi:hypothetical protein
MKNTIQAKVGYRIKRIKNKENYRVILDGDEVLFIAEVKSMEDYIDECKSGNNECAEEYEVFTTIKGNQFIYWGDYEINADYITKISV